MPVLWGVTSLTGIRTRGPAWCSAPPTVATTAVPRHPETLAGLHFTIEAAGQDRLTAGTASDDNDRVSPAYPLHTNRLVLRPLREEDIDTVLAYRNDPEVSALQDWNLPVYAMSDEDWRAHQDSRRG